MAKKAPKRRTVEQHRQCPVCYTGQLNGVGAVYSTHGNKSYHKCDRCGHTWSVRVVHERTVIEHRRPEVQTQDPPETSERDA